ncbi:MAG: ABC transporter permease [Chroococcidiopsidaceae cyanobacterium CP_BM_RX_35]|nr:ABC transporter permease [Chroococcidiopsidaceae cyanobacterium CP_BM_RX_35]
MSSNQQHFDKDTSSKLIQKLTRNAKTKVIYTPESQIRHPLKLFRDMKRDLLASRELAWRLLVRDINAQYRQSFLGIAWAFIPPILTAAGLTFAKNTGIINISNTDLPYPAYVMLNMTLWQTFVDALNSPIQGVVESKQMLVRINFPREAIILAKLGQLFFNFAIKLLLIIGLFIWFKISVSWTIILAPVALIHLIILATFIGLMLAPLGGLYIDISKGLLLATGFWFFLTPVIYPVPKSGTLEMLVKLNPVTPLLVTTRELATTGVISDPQSFWIASIFAITGLLVAWIVYRLAMPYVVERMSS